MSAVSKVVSIEESASVHVPVMKEEILYYLKADRQGHYLDCTFGGGGHSKSILQAHSHNTVCAVDRDLRALERGQKLVAEYAPRLTLKHGSFADVASLYSGEKFGGVLVDLGISTDQLKEGRGFSFHDNGPLDMRMDESAKKTASDVVNNYSQRELMKVLRQGGVSGLEAMSVCAGILKARPIMSTIELTRVINRAASSLTRKKKVNPSTVIFQAIRMEVNNELEQIDLLLTSIASLVSSNARLAILTFHSGEDTVVTRKLREWENKETAPARLQPLSAQNAAKPSNGKLITKKAVLPSDEEIEKNAPSRSAKLRVFEFGEIQ